LGKKSKVEKECTGKKNPHRFDLAGMPCRGKLTQVQHHACSSLFHFLKREAKTFANAAIAARRAGPYSSFL
jgi:hypothetical protein